MDTTHATDPADATPPASAYPQHRRLHWSVGLLLVSLLGIATFGWRYWEPRSLFWDENYHIASAHKQLAGVMYMETHPPLGKMLIAAGEHLLGRNAGKDFSTVLRRDYISNGDLPRDYDYAGVRLASVLSMILAIPLLYLLILRITGSGVCATVCAALPALDNALLVHTRAAMLEGPQILFAILALYGFARCVTAPRIRAWHYLLLGALIGLAMAVKLNAAVLLILLVALHLVHQWTDLRAGRIGALLRRSALAVPLGTAGVVASFCAVFWLHIAMTGTLGGQLYKASSAYITHLREGTAATPAGFTTGLRDHLRYIGEYSAGVPRLDVCKPGENGSVVAGWPLGGKTINYRWNREVVDGQSRVAYTYLVGNPLVWWPVLAGVLLALALVACRWVFGIAIADRRLFLWMSLNSGLWLAYMLAILQIERVMYLYHYLLPLIFGIVNLAVVMAYLLREGLAQRRWHTRINVLAYGLLAAVSFAHFAPLTYGTPLTQMEFEQRQWFGLWRLEPVR